MAAKYLEITYRHYSFPHSYSYYYPCDKTVTHELVTQLSRYMRDMAFHSVTCFDMTLEAVNLAIRMNDILGYERFEIIDQILTAEVLRRFIRYDGAGDVSFDSIGSIDFKKYSVTRN